MNEPTPGWVTEEREWQAIEAAVRWFVLAVAIVSLASVGGCYLIYYAPARAGLCQGSAPGIAGWVWVACPKEPGR